MSKKGNIDIIGSCVSREPFNYRGLINHPVNEYIFGCSPLFINEECPIELIQENDVNSEHNFIKRSICTCLNGTCWERIENSDAECLIMDNHYFTAPLF